MRPLFDNPNWRVEGYPDEDGKPYRIVFASYIPEYGPVSTIVCQISGGGAFAENNARLIRAAPDLYLAVKRLLTEGPIAMNDLREAIKKAEAWQL